MYLYRDQAQGFGPDEVSQRRLLRSLMNLRNPAPLSADYLELQDGLLRIEREEKGVVDAMRLPVISGRNIVLWQGDITRLDVDAIVNAANGEMLGCFHPCHGCIDNAIHSAAGLQLREECNDLMRKQGFPENPGRVKVTRAYNLPSRFIFHTVGPIVFDALTPEDRSTLRSCYLSCLATARDLNLKSIAFCCISTGEFRFPRKEAAETAVETIREFLRDGTGIERIVFNVFKDADRATYEGLLSKNGI